MIEIFGIVNLSRDSFYARSVAQNSSEAIARARELMKNGADLIDIGAQASNPSAAILSAEDEWKMLEPALIALKSEGIRFSVDSFNSTTQLRAISAGASYINDINGFSDSSIYSDLAQSSVKLIVMHRTQNSEVADHSLISPIAAHGRVLKFFRNRIEQLTSAGIEKSRIVIDPGMGFFLSTIPEASIKVLQSISLYKKEFGTELLISVSRKSFLRSLARCDVEQALAPTIAAELYAAAQGANYIRTHNPIELRQAIAIENSLNSSIANI